MLTGELIPEGEMALTIQVSKVQEKKISTKGIINAMDKLGKEAFNSEQIRWIKECFLLPQ